MKTIKRTSLLTLLWLLSYTLFSQESVVTIDSIFFHKDESKGIILINKDVQALNTLYPEIKNRIRAEGVEYTFALPLPHFEIGTAYPVTNPSHENFELYFTQLPIVHIDTIEPIVDEPRVYAHFSICETNGNVIEQGIGVEYRGGSTQAFPKKSLRIEFWKDETGNDTENISLLGMRSDDDWNLQAMYNEPLRMRTKIGFALWNQMDTLYYWEDEPKAVNGVHQKYVELFISDQYRGVYTLSERIDRKQLRLKKSENGAIAGELYKSKYWGEATSFHSLPPYDNNSESWGGYNYIYPKDTIDWANLYDFVGFVIQSDSATFYAHYPDRFIMDNAVNYFIFTNLLRARDNIVKNLFVARYQKDAPYFYVPWDLDGTLGITWKGEQEDITTDMVSSRFYDRLMGDTIFTNKLTKRWNNLRKTVISTDSIVYAFNHYYHYLNSNGVYERESKAWEAYDLDYTGNIQYLSNWTDNRIHYLDSIFNNLPGTGIYSPLTPPAFAISIYPNPASDFLTIKLSGSESQLSDISLFNTLGNCLLHTKHRHINISALEQGLYFVVVDEENGNRQVSKLWIAR
ncbi:MAG: hypothetical protein CSA04_02805 [Bacteroidetes bacterium]|nr:MAG: hypothetical protein CSA04_02805 [Bacteroidota bacterium]